TNVKVNVPLYQPANLVATHSVTSTYYAPSSADIPPTVVNRAELGVTDGPVQLPTNPNGPAAGNGIASRNLRLFQNGSFNGARTISPFGYTTQMRVVVGPENLVAQPVQTRVTGRSPSDTFAQRVTNAGGAFREFEVGFGVTPDISMEVAGQNTQNSVIDLGSVGHSFGEQNGSLGYGGSDPIFATGFLPAPLADTGIFGANSPYQAFFKPFTIRNVGNVNLYNLRASQKVEVPQFQGAYTPGSGFPFAYVSMRSLTVDPRFGIMAAKADPRLPGGVAPQIVTSLDPRFDASWDRWIAAQPEFATPTADGTTPYQVFYQQFGGRHTLHKPVPGGAPTVLNVPDVPSRDIRPGEQQPNGLPTVVGVAVPLGTPSGTYSTVNGSVPFVVFEDHDTDINYAGVPTTNGIARFDGTLPVTAAGPLYGGSNESHPGKVRNIRSRGNGSNGEGIYRPRNLVINGTGRRLEYLPSAPGGANSPGTTVSGATASDSMNIKIEVREAPLTGDIIDIALGAAVSIVTGRLPGIDLYPLIDRSTTTQRPAYALTPAAYRSANGNLNVYFSRNYQGDPTGRFAQPGQAYNLFHTHMIWNSALGTWQASSPGVPVNGVLVNTGKWFTDALPIAVPDPIPGVTDPAEANQSNTSPAVLTGNSGAALYWLNTVPRSSGQPYSQIMVGSLDANGVPTGQPQPFIERYDPARQRYQPRPLFLTAGTDAYALVFYYGGTDGKWNLYYNLRAAGQDGFPIGAPANALTSNNSAEIPLPLPSTFVSATDPSPVLHPQFVPIIGNRAIPDTVVDVYFSGITRNRPQAEIYMARYRVVAVPGGLPRLSATADDTRGQLFLMPRVFSEPLRRQGRSNLYQAQHIAWYDRLTDNPRTAGYDDRQSLPVITIRYGGQTANSVTVGPANWQAEPSSGILYQSFTRNGQETIVYVNTIAGTVQFRGTPGQGVPVDADTVLADYQPSVYRLTDGEGSKTGAYLVHDTRPLYRISGNQVTGAFQPAFNYTGAVFRRLISNNNTAEANVPIAGRLWIFYQKGATNGRGTLTWQVRRVGFNLNSIRYEDGGLKGAPEVLPDGRPAPKGIALSDPNANGNQFPIITRVIVGNGVGAVPYDVDFARGILFVGPQYHGLPVQITYQRAADNQTITLTDGVGGQRLRLDYIPDTYPASPEPPADNRNNPPPPTVVVAGNEVTLTQSVNETQPFAFLDLFNPLPGINRTGIEMPDALTDPTLQIGRLWLLWSSPRSRLGVAGNAADPFPQGFDIFWQTFAPEFNLTSSPAR
ncbi:MAG: hypothetical protein SFU56_04890, partial [Capsulimonadales bacterium]|nr:hypothetical protein [Capsulimonadales bacterium]